MENFLTRMRGSFPATALTHTTQIETDIVQEADLYFYMGNKKRRRK
jgi:hypothetical protein